MIRNGHRARLAAYLFVVAAGAVGFWRVESTVNNLERTQDDICESLDTLVTVAARESDADPARVEAFLEELHDNLDHC